LVKELKDKYKSFKQASDSAITKEAKNYKVDPDFPELMTTEEINKVFT
jgi:hypothetical protein